MSAPLRVANEDFRLHIHLLKGVAKAALYCAQHSHPPNPERAETRSCPMRAHSYRARSASKKGTWPVPLLLANFSASC